MVDLQKRLKNPLRLVAKTMQPGFTDAKFVQEFRILCPLLWRELYEIYISCSTLDVIRSKKERSNINFPSPYKFIHNASKHLLPRIRKEHKQGLYNEEDANKIREELKKKSSVDVQKFQTKLATDLYLIQEVTPSYISELISMYYDDRMKDTMNVSYRLWILQEVAKYRSLDTMIFLKQVQCGEKNEHLRLVAYHALLQMHAFDVQLHRKRDGVKKQNQIIEPHAMSTPNELLHAVYSADFEQIKKFDVFISHSSQNKELIHDIVKTLNTSRYVCYTDWMVDRDQLRRDLTSKETAEVIANRIKQSKVVLYVLTRECNASKWSPWELGYAYALNKPICVLQIEAIDDKPEYLDLHNTFDTLQDVVSYISNL